MKTFVDVLGEQLKEMSRQKSEMFGSIPDDYRQVVEELLSKPGPTMMMMTPVLQDWNKMDLVKSMLELGGEKSELEGVDSEELKAMLVKLDASKINLGEVVRKNWSAFEPVFLIAYLAYKTGRAVERDESATLAKMAALEERRKANPNAFDEITMPTANLLPVSDTPGLPAISEEQAARFRAEMEADFNQKEGY